MIRLLQELEVEAQIGSSEREVSRRAWSHRPCGHRNQPLVGEATRELAWPIGHRTARCASSEGPTVLAPPAHSPRNRATLAQETRAEQRSRNRSGTRPGAIQRILRGPPADPSRFVAEGRGSSRFVVVRRDRPGGLGQRSHRRSATTSLRRVSRSPELLPK